MQNVVGNACFVATFMLGLLAWAGAARADLTVGGTYPEYPQDLKPDPWTVGTLYVGWSEEAGFATGGQFECKDGGGILGDTVYLGYGALGSGVGTIRGQDPISQFPSKLNVSNLAVGWLGIGDIGVREGGRLQSGFTILGNYGINNENGRAGRGTVTISGQDSIWNAGIIHVGGAGEGTVHVNGGGRVEAVDTYVGLWHPTGALAGFGTVEVRTGGVWNCSGIFSVGYQGLADVIVQGQGTIESKTGAITQDYGSTNLSHATVQDVGSTWRIAETFTVGGQLLVRSGGKVTNGGDARVNWNGGSLRPIAIVEDAGSIWENAAALRIGGDGDGGLYGYGEMRIRNGGAVTSVTGYVKNGPVIVTDPGSRWSVSDTLHVGYAGSLGTLQVIHGGLVESNDMYVGAVNGTGSVQVADLGSRIHVNHNLQIGSDSPGLENVMTLLPGGVVEVGNELTMGRLGQLNVQPGGLVTTERLTVQTIYPSQGGTIALNGAGSLIKVGQLLRAKNSENIVFGGGEIDLTDGSAIFEYDFFSPLAALRTEVSSGRNGGLWNGHGINSSSAAARTDTGLGIAEASAVGLTMFAGQPVDSTTVLIKYTYLGDATLDGQVDVADLGRLAANWQSSAGWSDGDFDYDGVVGIGDLGLLASNWQKGVGAPLGPSFGQALAAFGLPSASVPEPGHIGLLIAVAATALSRRRRERALARALPVETNHGFDIQPAVTTPRVRRARRVFTPG